MRDTERTITVEFDYSDDQKEHFSEDVQVESSAHLRMIRSILKKAEKAGQIEPGWYCDTRQSEATPSSKFLPELRAAVGSAELEV